MAISGDNSSFTNSDLKIGVATYNKAVGDYKGEVVKDSKEWVKSSSKSNQNRNYFNYEENTVAGKYVLKGKAGITANFYKAFSEAFDEYKNIIKKDLADLETNPNIRQAFSGTEIEKAVKNLLIAVETEANDYLFKLEKDEKTVIHGVEEAFKRQQAAVGSSMETDTKSLSTSNSSQEDINSFRSQASRW